MKFCGPLMSSLNRLKSLKENTAASWEANHCGHSEHLVSDVGSIFCCWDPSCSIFTWLRAGRKALTLYGTELPVTKVPLDGEFGCSWLAFLQSQLVKKVSFYCTWVRLMVFHAHTTVRGWTERDFLNKQNGERIPWVLPNGGFLLQVSGEGEWEASVGFWWESWQKAISSLFHWWLRAVPNVLGAGQQTTGPPGYDWEAKIVFFLEIKDIYSYMRQNNYSEKKLPPTLFTFHLWLSDFRDIDVSWWGKCSWGQRTVAEVPGVQPGQGILGEPGHRHPIYFRQLLGQR